MIEDKLKMIFTSNSKIDLDLNELDYISPILYKKTSTGKIQQWVVTSYVNESNVSVVLTQYGQQGSDKIQQSVETIIKGKNIGKSNETTPLEQATIQAKARYIKQLKKGYVLEIEDAIKGIVNSIIKGGVVVMTAHKESEQGHKIKYPAIVQPKLDGHRSSSQPEVENVATLWSRSRKEIKSMPHICKDLGKFNYLGYRFDGELYNHDYCENFEDLTSLLTPDEPVEGHEVMQYHIYDIIDDNLTNMERQFILDNLKSKFENTSLVIVESRIVNNRDELMEALEYYLELGYEGAMVRNMNGKYKHGKSYDLQKVKVFDDEEFRIVGVKIGTKGKMAGKAVFVCERYHKDSKLPIGITFDVKMTGDLDKLKEYAENPSLVIGKILTVKYQGYTKKNIKPRFPVGQRFRVDL